MLKNFLPNMVAGKGFKKNGPPEFSDINFDGCILFMKAHLGRMEEADNA
jgi:hypothetical protein